MTDQVFNVGDKVRVDAEREYFTTCGIDMVITEVVTENVDGETVLFYKTNLPCSVHGPHYNGFELVKLED